MSASKWILGLAGVAVIAGVGLLMVPKDDEAAASGGEPTKVVERAEPAKATPPAKPSAATTKPAKAEAEPGLDDKPIERPPGDPRSTDDAMAGLDVRNTSKAELIGMGLPEKLAGGVMVTKIDPRSSAAEAQLREGDIIVEAHRSDVTTISELHDAVEERDQTMLKVYRKGKPFQVVLHKPWKGNK